VRHLILALTLLLAAACSGALRSSAPAAQIYILRATNPATTATAAARAPGSVEVARPVAGPGLDSERIVIVQPDDRMSYYSGSRWAAELPLLVEALAIERLRGTGAWDAVHNSLSAIHSEYFLQITIRRFEAEYTTEAAPPTARVIFDCEIGQRASRTLLGSFAVEGAAVASTNRVSAVVAAFEQAANAALTDLVAKSIAAVKSPQAPSTP
jgi:cholesterol transport system auxiliary component